MCPGVDGNRNYDFFWNTVGTSSNPCSDQYAGGRPFSEVETRAVDGILKEHLNKLAMYITMHSFGSMILYSWGHDGTLSEHAFDLHTVGVKMADVIVKSSLSHFPRYIVGNSALVLNYRASGGSEDYAHSIGVKLAYTFELPGFGRGGNGFILNPRYIKQVSAETWAGVVIGAREAGKLFNARSTQPNFDNTRQD
ncbi:jg5089 [Pararge aegeria aegeria]|uniref:Jg5089 protein n=2 Tax=Pararge aegeria TaxID=116150 RepID=A0A8S4QQY8_9NEOP|nr:jg5089 [Pararge aegeria aegeria]